MSCCRSVVNPKGSISLSLLLVCSQLFFFLFYVSAICAVDPQTICKGSLCEFFFFFLNKGGGGLSMWDLGIKPSMLIIPLCHLAYPSQTSGHFFVTSCPCGQIWSRWCGSRRELCRVSLHFYLKLGYLQQSPTPPPQIPLALVYLCGLLPILYLPRASDIYGPVCHPISLCCLHRSSLSTSLA